MSNQWTKDSWKEFPIKQQPEYEDLSQVERVIKTIESYPPLVFSGEVEKMKRELADAGEGKRFVLQGGDCAERFVDCNSQTIVNKLKILLQMSVILTHGTRMPVVRIGRIAGQYAKPRSSNTEVVNGMELPSYRGDIVNDFEPTPEARRPDPERMIKSYFHSAATLNFIRATVDGGFADLHHPYQWNLQHFENTDEWAEYGKVVEKILDSLNFMEAFGGINPETLRRIEFYTSHEGLLLGYESALTRKSPLTDKYYNMGAHMLWIGERTRQLDGAHVEYFRGLGNPIGVKVGATMDKDELLELIQKLNPQNEGGRITLITRFGINKIDKILPGLIKAVKKAGKKVTWVTDPMHANGQKTDNGIKTRDFKDIEGEMAKSYRIHLENASTMSGVHFELTGDDVTECVGGAIGLHQGKLTENYETYCDPRLNYAQSLEVAFLISRLHRIEEGA